MGRENKRSVLSRKTEEKKTRKIRTTRKKTQNPAVQRHTRIL